MRVWSNTRKKIVTSYEKFNEPRIRRSFKIIYNQLSILIKSLIWVKKNRSKSGAYIIEYF